MSAMILLLLVSAALALCALGLLRKGRQQAASEGVLERLGQAEQEQAPNSHRYWLAIEKMFYRAGLEMSPQKLRHFILVWLGLVVIGGLFAGALGVGAMLIGPLLLLRAVLSWRYRKRVARMVQQLAPMLDQVNRSLQTGRTLGDALLVAIEQAPDPLKSAMAKVSLNVQVGMPLAEAVEEVAELYEQEELRILALGLKVNDRYGGSAAELLNNLISVIHEREQAARQLKAMTGETRITAIVLALLPAAVAGYILAINPEYILSMWQESSGRIALLAAFVLQASGCYMLWRMMKSI